MNVFFAFKDMEQWKGNVNDAVDTPFRGILKRLLVAVAFELILSYTILLQDFYA